MAQQRNGITSLTDQDRRRVLRRITHTKRSSHLFIVLQQLTWLVLDTMVCIRTGYVQHTSSVPNSEPNPTSALSLHALPFIVRRASTAPLGVITSGNDPVPAAQP